ncbi:hypothetical protein [Vreelandella neptunia]|jgi:hypothetical protein|uniref:Secreted protein n=1 Tax=Vreelandella neptunia TaxID=115551 RepID=A0ABS9S9V8_9GAMM|nr:hypothetical protein [Halomonas neptunia]MCH4812870.1 hypothetical protein [Halomonas neptunia]
MKNLLLALPLSILLLSTAQAQQIETEQDLLNGMLHQMTGQLTEGKADLTQNSFMTAENVTGSQRDDTAGYKAKRMTKPLASNGGVSSKPITRPILGN